jgi:hypothetical protein
VPDPAASGTAARRVVRFFSFVTIQRNVLVLVAAVALALAPARDEYWSRLVRLASLVGVTVTFLVNVAVLRPLTANRYEGIWVVTAFALHGVTPALAVVGRLRFGPRPRRAPRLVAEVLIWPALWVAYTSLRAGSSAGIRLRSWTSTGTDIRSHSPASRSSRPLRIAVGAVFVWLDGRLPPRPAGG